MNMRCHALSVRQLNTINGGADVLPSAATDKKLIIERHYRNASGHTLARLCESYGQFDNCERAREGNTGTQRGGGAREKVAQKAGMLMDKQRADTASTVNELM